MIKGRTITSFIISPDLSQGQGIKGILDNLQTAPSTFLRSFSQAREAFTTQNPELALIDVTSNQDKGLELIKHIRQNHPQSVCIALAPGDDRNMHIQALRCGAQTTLSIPLNQEELSLVISNIFSLPIRSSRSSENDLQLRESDGFCGLVGTSQTMSTMYGLIEQLGQEGQSTVLIQGESGVGKELVAKALHKCSPRANKNFIPVNCAAIPDSLLESELFGHQKGAFTGAAQNKKGRLHHAHQGTLFLDEIGEMQPNLQAKLLRVLQEREFEPIGSVQPVKIDTRVIAATNMDLEQAVQNNTFRTDLYYRLSVIPLHIPPLRNRRADIPLLLNKFALLFHRGKKSKPKEFSPDAIRILQNYPWPGNVRELKNLVQRLCVLHKGDVIDVHDLPLEFQENNQNLQPQPEEDELAGTTAEIQSSLRDSNLNLDFNSQVSEFEDRLILQALIATNGNKKQAAKRLNLKRTTLLEKIKKKDLDRIFTSWREQNSP